MLIVLDRGQLFHVTKCKRVKNASVSVSEKFPTFLNQETRKASNLCHGLC